MSKIKVMLVDDEPFIRQGMRMIIDWESYGYEIAAEAENGMQALEMLDGEEIDLVFVDQMCIRDRPEPDAPYGREVKKALDHALALGERMGFKTGNIDNRVGYVEYGDGEEMAAVLGHVDVVPLGEGWNYDCLLYTSRCV